MYLYNAAFIPDIIRSLFAGAMTAVLIMILNQVKRILNSVFAALTQQYRSTEEWQGS